MKEIHFSYDAKNKRTEKGSLVYQLIFMTPTPKLLQRRKILAFQFPRIGHGCAFSSSIQRVMKQVQVYYWFIFSTQYNAQPLLLHYFYHKLTYGPKPKKKITDIQKSLKNFVPFEAYKTRNKSSIVEQVFVVSF